MVGAHVGFRGKSLTVTGGLRRESSRKTFSVGLIRVAIIAAGRENRAMVRLGVV